MKRKGQGKGRGGVKGERSLPGLRRTIFDDSALVAILMPAKPPKVALHQVAIKRQMPKE